jgi:hypothetical protein
VKTQISTSVSEETRRKADAIMARTGYGLRELLTVAIDRMYREAHMPEITAAQMIRPYVGPQYLVEPVGDVSDADDIAAINDADWVVILDRHVQGWGEYNAIVRVSANDVTADYLARL